MKCAWQEYLQILPIWMRSRVDNLGAEKLEELRLRIGRMPELVLNRGHVFLERKVTSEDLSFCISAASQYSPWASTTISDGYLTATGGHRIGICGEAAIIDGKVTTVRNVTSLCLRVARDFPGIGREAAKTVGSVLILGSPGRGKTTLLRDLIRQKSDAGPGAVAVVDERREVFPTAPTTALIICFFPGLRTEVLSGFRKQKGLEIMIRTMNPAWIAVDEITAEEDCCGVIQACNCGVSILATAHGESVEDFMQRPVYKPLLENSIFQNIIVMQPDKSWKLERMNR